MAQEPRNEATLGSEGLYQHAVVSALHGFFSFAHPTAVAGVTSTFARADISRHVDDPWYHGDISSWEAEKSRSQHTLYTKYEGAVKPTQAKPRGSRKADPSQNKGKLLTSSI